MATNSLFNELSVPEAPPDSHYGLRAEFQADRHPDKVNLVIGAYKDDQGRPWILPVVRKVGQMDPASISDGQTDVDGVIRLLRSTTQDRIRTTSTCLSQGTRLSARLRPESSWATRLLRAKTE